MWRDAANDISLFKMEILQSLFMAFAKSTRIIRLEDVSDSSDFKSIPYFMQKNSLNSLSFESMLTDEKCEEFSFITYILLSWTNTLNILVYET